MEVEKAENKLQSSGIKPTAMRLLVLKKLMEQSYAISHKELTDLFDRVDTVTIFRTLKTFVEHKLIHSIDDGTGQLKYALCQEGCTCSPQDLHTHFHCTKCQKTYCLNNMALPAISLPNKFSLKHINLTLKGLCDKCH